jgi:hypothetical protein
MHKDRRKPVIAEQTRASQDRLFEMTGGRILFSIRHTTGVFMAIFLLISASRPMQSSVSLTGPAYYNYHSKQEPNLDYGGHRDEIH